MTQLLSWDDVGERKYETGIDHGILFVRDEEGEYTGGVVWNGLISVTEKPTGAEATPMYADNIKYLNILSAEELELTLEAYTYPDEFAVCDGSIAAEEGVILGQQSRAPFGLCYRTILGNDVDGNDLGYKLHLIYGAYASPSERAYNTVNDTPDAITFNWNVTTVPELCTDFKPVASIIIDSTLADETDLAALEAMLYGTEATVDPVVAEVPAEMPLPDAILTMFAGA